MWQTTLQSRSNTQDVLTVEVHVNENLPAKYFVGLGVDKHAPDHSTLTVFRDRLTKHGNLEIFELYWQKLYK